MRPHDLALGPEIAAVRERNRRTMVTPEERAYLSNTGPVGSAWIKEDRDMQVIDRDGNESLWEGFDRAKMSDLLNDPETDHVRVRRMSQEQRDAANRKIEARRRCNKAAKAARRKQRRRRR